MSVLKVDSIVPANIGSENYYLGRAWCTFSMNAASTGIIAGKNVSSLSDLGVGAPQFNLANALSGTAAALTVTPSRYGTGIEVAVQHGGIIDNTLTVRGFCGSDSTARNDWDLGSMGVTIA